MRTFENLGKKKVIIGLVHLLPLPGTPFYEDGNLEMTFDKAIADATALYEGGADGCLVQTIDGVYPAGDEADYARVAALANIVKAVSDATGPEFQIGVQILWNALRASLAVAKVSGGSFLRCNAFVGSTMTTSGIVEADPVGFHQYRKQIDAQDIKLIAEVESMHFKWLGGKPVAEVARTAARTGANAVEIAHPDEETQINMIHDIKHMMPDLPVILGGHTNHDNAARRLAEADGAFVGTCFETEGWGGRVDVDRVKAYMDIVTGLS